MTGAVVGWTADGAVEGIGTASVISDVAGSAAGASASPCWALFNSAFFSRASW